MKKNINQITALFIAISIAVSISSCIAVVSTPHDNGKHKGWSKNPNNPHNPNTTNPGHNKNKK